MIALWLALVTAAAPAGSLEQAAATVGEQVAVKAAPAKSAVAVFVLSPVTPELSRAVQTAVVADLSARAFKKVMPLSSSKSPESAEDDARASGMDWLVRLTVRIDSGEITLGGDLVPTWVNFWAGADPIRSAGGGPLAARAPIDSQVTTLAHLPENPAHPLEVATRFALRTLTKLPEHVVALAVGDLDGDHQAEIVALTPTQIVVLKATGQIVAHRDLSSLPRAPRPPREPAGTLAVEQFENGKARVLAFSFSRAKGEVLELQGSELKPMGLLEQPAICSGTAGTLQGLPVSGKNVLAPEVRLAGRAGVLPFGPVAMTANPRAGNPAFAAVAPDGALQLVDIDLKSTELAGTFGVALALGDLDGDGVAELVVTLPVRSDDRVRLLRLDGTQIVESEIVTANLVSAVAGDLDGDGRDEAVLAGWTDAGTTLFVLGAQR